MIPGMELAPGIHHALQLLEDAKEYVREQMKTAQGDCPHTFLVEDKSFGNYRRICVRCRLEEMGAYQSDFTELEKTPDRLVLTPSQVGQGGVSTMGLPT